MMPTTVTTKRRLLQGKEPPKKQQHLPSKTVGSVPTKKSDRRKRWIPDLKRYHKFKTSRSIYIPFDVPDGQKDEYSGKFADPEAVVYQVCIALSRMFGFSMNLISLEMKAFMLKVITERSPHLCCSSLRAIMEGRVPGIPKPTSHDPVINHHARTTLMMMDVMDTIVCEYLREQEEGLSLLDGGDPAPYDEKTSDLGPDITEEEALDSGPPYPTMAEQLAAKERESRGASGTSDAGAAE